MKSKRSKLLQFDKETIEAIWERDYGTCLFCNLNYHIESSTQMGYDVKDIMHYAPKSQGGLGIEQNGVLGCRYHHMLLDNGSKGIRADMLTMMREHLRAHYPDWDEDKLIYKKYKF